VSEVKDRKSERGCNQVMPWGSVAAPGEAIARRLVSSTSAWGSQPASFALSNSAYITASIWVPCLECEP
jgi:hypothetical protein